MLRQCYLSLMILILSFVFSTNAEAGRRSLRVDFGAWTEGYAIGSENCPGTAEFYSDVSWENFSFEADPDRADSFYLVDSYCQTAVQYQSGMTDSEYLNSAIFFDDEAGLAAKVGTNTGPVSTVEAIRYTFLDGDRFEDGTDGYQYAFYFFPNGVTLATVYGSWISESFRDLEVSGHFNGPYDGEYLCFADGEEGVEYIGIWDGSPAGTQAAAGCESTSTTTVHRTFSMEGDGLFQGICAPGELSEIYIDIYPEYWFSEEVYLSTVNLPTGFNVTFDVNPLNTPDDNFQPSYTPVFIDVEESVAANRYEFQIRGSGGDIDKFQDVQIDVFDSAPESPSPSFPADTAAGIVRSPMLQWTSVPQAQYYIVEVDDDPAFGSIDFSAGVSGTEVMVTSKLNFLTTYYWRVSADNACGYSANSSTFSFTTHDSLIMRDGYEQAAD